MQTQSLRERIKETVAGSILDAAEEVAAGAGVGDTSVQAIAQRAGVSVGTIYNYFTDRTELFAAVFARRRAELLAHLDATTRAAKGGFEEQLDSFVRGVLTFFDARRAFLRLAVEGGPPPQPKAGDKTTDKPRSTLQQLTVRAERIVALGLKEGQLRADGGELFGAFLVAALKTILSTRAASPKPLAADTEQVVALFLNGAGARAGGRR